MPSEIRFGDDSSAYAGLHRRILAGEVIVARGALQHFGLLDRLRNASMDGVRACMGEEIAARVAELGFERLHECVPADKIPELTEAVYSAVRPHAGPCLDIFVRGAFPDVKDFYYEETPNVRFHIPYDLARKHNSLYRDFAKSYGEGKIAAHGPHRDSWLDCPANGANLWFAIGPVRHGNGLTVYEEDYGRTFRWQRSGDVSRGERLHKPTTFELAPGDGVLFHTDQVHGSELNRTNETRFVISFRMTFDRPYFPNKHFHRYVHADLAKSWLKPVAHVPAMVQASYVRSLVQRVREKLQTTHGNDDESRPPEAIGQESAGHIRVKLADVPVGSVRGVNAGLCVARLSDDKCIAFTRRCPHSGGDLADGWVDGENVVCPWHNMPFDSSGRSPCKSLPPLHAAPCRIEGEEILIETVSSPSMQPAK